MSYEDDELERMRARREQRRSSGAYGNSGQRKSSDTHGSGAPRRSTSRPESGRRTSDRDSARGNGGGSGSSFKSGYNGPKGGSGGGSGRGERRVSGSKRRSAQKKKRILIIAAEIFILLALVVGAAGWYVYERTFGSLQDIKFDEANVENVNLSSEQLESMKGYMTVACFGVDSRSVGGKMNVGKGTNADVNLICSINMDTGEIKLVSVFRDTYLNISDKNTYNKINAAYAAGGPEQAVKALNKNLGLNITEYATFNWKAVADAINILGGVDIEISDNEFSWINAYITETVNETGIGSEQLKKAGLVHMDGVQAVAYGRLRLGDTDYARTERQRIVLQKAFDKAKQASWADLNNIIQTVTPQLAASVKPADLVPLARNIKKYYMGETAGFPSARGEGTVGKLGDCVIPQTLESNVKVLHKFLFGVEDYAVPSNVKEYSNHISEATGMYKEGKHIGHVPVDQGVSARSFINKKQQKANDKAAAKEEEKTTSESSTASTEETSTEESTGDSTADSSSESTRESSTGFDDWEEEEWETDEWIGGPGSNGPGSGPGGNGSGFETEATIPSDKRPSNTTEAYNEDATGPGRTPSPTSAPTSARPNNSSPTTSGNTPVAPGSSNRSNSSNSSNSDRTEAVAGPGAGPGA